MFAFGEHMKGVREMKKIIAFLLILTMLFAFSSCERRGVEFCELGIGLTSEFKPYDASGAFNVAYSDGNLIVGITRYSFVDCIEQGLLTTHSPERLAEIYLERLGVEPFEGIISHGDVPYFIYEMERDGEAYDYTLTFFRTQFAYFVITFITPADRHHRERVRVFNFMDSVYIVEDYLQ